MAKLKTKPTQASVQAFFNEIADEATRQDCIAIAKIMEEVTGEKPKMWGQSIVGFGTYHYKYESGREGDWMLTGFSPRKRDLTLYIVMGFEKYSELMQQLGKYSTGKSCLYIKRLSDINTPTLKKLIKQSVKELKAYIAVKVVPENPAKR
jgi:nucleoid DNA-binding protein